MPSTRSGASYNPSSSSQKGHRPDYGRSQSVTEGQGADTATRSHSGHLQSQPEGLQKCTAAQRVPDPCRSVKNCMNSYLTVRKFLGHTNTCKLLNGWHPLMKKKNIMLLTAEWRKTTLQHPNKCQKQPQWPAAAIPTGKISHKLRTRAKERHQPQNLTARATGFQ
ncbi:hypothetical protein O181_014342 [Austropuccinia psidii MF-1]|uniref:Uncharacterized protein n=1 Tax=Austropuccinia psidii MF-1 TaxID=1389203 RepID=A0A9Q3GPR6_9BASI|nr:hypothetical protein [Austropuccinia psidii MF-1]